MSAIVYPEAVKISAASLLHFEPRRLTSDGTTIEDQREQLFEENPAFARSVDCAKLGHDVMGAWKGLANGPLGRLASGGVAAGAGIWGANKLLRGQTALDRIEGVALLAMATDKAITASGANLPVASMAAGLVQGGADIIVGAADTVRGYREDNKRRLTVGLCQMAVGACLGTSALFPSAAGISTAVMCAAVVTKQLAIGFHIGLPDK